MKKKILAAASALILLAAAIAAVFLYKNRDSDWGSTRLMQDVIKKAENMEMDALFLSMYPVETYEEEILYTCLLADTEILQLPITSGEQLVGMLEEVLSKPNKLSRVFLGLYKESIVEEGTEGGLPVYESEWLKQGYSWEEAILELGKAHPDITFEIMFYYPRISYWTAMEEECVEEILDWYAYAGELYSHHDVVQNVRPYMPGCEEWLICNENNYQDDYNVTREVARELEMLVLCDHKTIMVPISVQEQCDKLRGLIQKYREQDREYGQLSNQTYVFLGDSVIGNYTGSLSVPGVAAYMTGADTINCGFGGLAAAKADADSVGIAGVLDCLLATEANRSVEGLENETVQAGILEFWEKNFAEDAENLTFFISFGINDYAIGCPVYNDTMDDGCYYGALSNAIDRLQETYPRAQIILMTPNYVEIFEHGTLDNSGKGFVFKDYAGAVLDLAAEKNLQVVDVYKELGITAENTGTYLADGCHPNYYGRFKIGEMIWECMK